MRQWTVRHVGGRYGEEDPVRTLNALSATNWTIFSMQSVLGRDGALLYIIVAFHD